MKIISPTHDQLPALVDLFEGYRHFYGKEPDRAAAEDFISDRLRLGDSKIFMLLTPTDTPIGFTQLYPLFSSTRMCKIWLLNDLYIIEGARGNGYSKLLMERAKQFCRETNAAALSLETAKANIPGNKLYMSEGFILDQDYNHYEWKA